MNKHEKLLVYMSQDLDSTPTMTLICQKEENNKVEAKPATRKCTVLV